MTPMSLCLTAPLPLVCVSRPFSSWSRATASSALKKLGASPSLLCRLQKQSFAATGHALSQGAAAKLGQGTQSATGHVLSQGAAAKLGQGTQSAEGHALSQGAAAKLGQGTQSAEGHALSAGGHLTCRMLRLSCWDGACTEESYDRGKGQNTTTASACSSRSLGGMHDTCMNTPCEPLGEATDVNRHVCLTALTHPKHCSNAAVLVGLMQGQPVTGACTTG